MADQKYCCAKKHMKILPVGPRGYCSFFAEGIEVHGLRYADRLKAKCLRRIRSGAMCHFLRLEKYFSLHFFFTSQIPCQHHSKFVSAPVKFRVSTSQIPCVSTSQLPCQHHTKFRAAHQKPDRGDVG
jgi:hypothetical protein